jgi:hypothetical protein
MIVSISFHIHHQTKDSEPHEHLVLRKEAVTIGQGQKRGVDLTQIDGKGKRGRQGLSESKRVQKYGNTNRTDIQQEQASHEKHIPLTRQAQVDDPVQNKAQKVLGP